jgi:hypothetical protein
LGALGQNRRGAHVCSGLVIQQCCGPTQFPRPPRLFRNLAASYWNRCRAAWRGHQPAAPALLPAFLISAARDVPARDRPLLFSSLWR